MEKHWTFWYHGRAYVASEPGMTWFEAREEASAALGVSPTDPDLSWNGKGEKHEVANGG
jgi:hypothetical protein